MVWTATQGVLLPHEVQLLMHHEHHKPNFVLAVLTQVVDNLPTSDARKQAMDASLTKFHLAVGSCERMIKTPIPRSYTRLVLNCLPLCLSLVLLYVLLCPGRCLSSCLEPFHLPLPLCFLCLSLAHHCCFTLRFPPLYLTFSFSNTSRALFHASLLLSLCCSKLRCPI